jgi:NAD(P)-dependent dehydrogenase (short-subunit alcohol dehydrogenase family)
MAEVRTVVITGASRGLGFASAVRLYNEGWRVVAAMRSPDQGVALLRDATGADHDDGRLVGVRLDLMNEESIAAAAEQIEALVGAPHALVHNAGIASIGMSEELDRDLWSSMLATHLTGPVALTKALLPVMRAAGRGRIVLVSSAGGVRGQPGIAAYSAAKGALERWGESMATEISPFGLGVTVLVAGAYDTDIIDDRAPGYPDYRIWDGPYSPIHHTMDVRGHFAMRFARPPTAFTDGLVKALNDRAPFRRRSAGPDAAMLMVFNRVLPSAAMHHMARAVMGIPRHGALRSDAPQLTTPQRLMVRAMGSLPPPVMNRLIVLATWLAPNRSSSPSAANGLGQQAQRTERQG